MQTKASLKDALFVHQVNRALKAKGLGTLDAEDQLVVKARGGLRSTVQAAHALYESSIHGAWTPAMALAEDIADGAVTVVATGHRDQSL